MTSRGAKLLKLCGVPAPPPQGQPNNFRTKVGAWLDRQDHNDFIPDDSSSLAPSIAVPPWFSDNVKAHAEAVQSIKLKVKPTEEMARSSSPLRTPPLPAAKVFEVEGCARTHILQCIKERPKRLPACMEGTSCEKGGAVTNQSVRPTKNVSPECAQNRELSDGVSHPTIREQLGENSAFSQTGSADTNQAIPQKVLQDSSQNFQRPSTGVPRSTIRKELFPQSEENAFSQTGSADTNQAIPHKVLQDGSQNFQRPSTAGVPRSTIRKELFPQSEKNAFSQTGSADTNQAIPQKVLQDSSRQNLQRPSTGVPQSTIRRELFPQPGNSASSQTDFMPLPDPDTSSIRLVSDLESAGIDISQETIVLSLNNDLDWTLEPSMDVETVENIEFRAEDDEDNPRKRESRPAMWKCNIAKAAKNSGKAHQSKRGIQRVAKEMGAPCKCPLKCCNSISEAERKSVHQKYWAIGSQDGQWGFIGNSIELHAVKRRTVVSENPYRKYSYKFKLLDKAGNSVYVCRTMFLNTLAISPMSFRTTVKKILRKQGVISPDKRGKHPKMKETSKLMQASIIDHVNKFPRVESHYCRKRSKMRYLEEHLSVSKMYRMYKIERGNQPHTAKKWQYQHVFRKFFRHKLKFFKPKKDQCSKCLQWKVKSPVEKAKASLKAAYEGHLKNKEESRAQKEKDSKSAATDKEMCVATFDLEKTLYCPKGENSEFFYLSKLKIYNFTIFQSVLGEGFCYCWDEATAGRTCNEFASCLFLFIEQKASEGYKIFHFYSDNCGAQNKNMNLFSMYNLASNRFNVKIIHRFLEPGHTQMECDSMHSLIERRSKTATIFAPSQWFAVIKTAKITNPRYKVKEMAQNDFLDFTNLQTQYHDWKKVPIKNLKELTVEKNHASYKTSLADGVVPKSVVILKSRPGRPINWQTYQPQRCYKEPIKISYELHAGLMKLCQSQAIPPPHHAYYAGLSTLPPKPKKKRQKRQQVTEEESEVSDLDEPQSQEEKGDSGEESVEGESTSQEETADEADSDEEEETEDGE